jgi:hypothetical protein
MKDINLSDKNVANRNVILKRYLLPDSGNLLLAKASNVYFTILNFRPRPGLTYITEIDCRVMPWHDRS